jgi:hypothetical protein
MIWMEMKFRTAQDKDLELDGDIDLASPFLHSILSGDQSTPSFEDIMAPAVTGREHGNG